MKHYNQIRRSTHIFFALLLCICMMLPMHATAISSELSKNLYSFNNSMATVLINLYADSDQNYSIGSTKALKDSKGDISYTFAQLLPYGYAIFNNRNMLLVEACFDNTAHSPISANDSSDYYYIGPSVFAVNENDKLILNDTREEVSIQILQTTASFEMQINSTNKEKLGYNKLATQNNTISSVPTLTVHSDSVGASYFSQLNDHGTNRNGTCTVLAAAMLLGYYDHNICDQYIADQYVTQASSTSSAGTTEAFHQLLCDYVYGDNAQGAIFISEALTGLNAYLDSRSLPVSFISNSVHNVRTTQNKIVSLIEHDHPAIASYFELYGATANHTMVVYGYKYTEYNDGNISIDAINNNSSNSTDAINYDTLMFRVHCGWGSGNNDVYYSSSWYSQYGYITDCSESGTHYQVFEKHTINNYHSGNYHYYQRKHVCCSCGNNYSYDWYSVPCDGNCFEMMSLGGLAQ